MDQDASRLEPRSSSQLSQMQKKNPIKLPHVAFASERGCVSLAAVGGCGTRNL